MSSRCTGGILQRRAEGETQEAHLLGSLLVTLGAFKGGKRPFPFGAGLRYAKRHVGRRLLRHEYVPK